MLWLFMKRGKTAVLNPNCSLVDMTKCVSFKGFFCCLFITTVYHPSKCDQHEVKRTVHLYFNWLQSCCNIVAIITPSLAVLCEDFMLILQNTDSFFPQGWLCNPIMNLPFYFRVSKMFCRPIVVWVCVCVCVYFTRICVWACECVCELTRLQVEAWVCLYTFTSF